MNILIFAGGSGTRLWPASRKSSPKQVLKLLENKTLLENTYDRCKLWVNKDRIFIATLSEYKRVIAKMLPGIKSSHYSLEPVLRDRGPAIALASLIMSHHDPDSIFMTMWSDHQILENKGYMKNLLKQAELFLKENPKTTLTVGVKPTYPHTGFGYIQKAKKINNKYKLPLFQVSDFKEKPDEKTAQKFLKSKKYLWNTGYFIWKTSTILELYKEHLPEVYEILQKIKPFIGTKKQLWAINRYYPQMPKVEIENGIIEKIKNDIATIEADIGWHDIGSWKIIKDVQSNGTANVSQGLHLDINSQDSLVYNYSKKQLVTTLNLKNTVVVVTDDAILVADKHRSEDLKKLIAKLKEDERLGKYL